MKEQLEPNLIPNSAMNILPQSLQASPYHFMSKIGPLKHLRNFGVQIVARICNCSQELFLNSKAFFCYSHITGSFFTFYYLETGPYIEDSRKELYNNI